jgi:hypothetical protein
VHPGGDDHGNSDESRERLVDDEFVRLVTLMKDADSVELTVPEPDHRSTARTVLEERGVSLSGDQQTKTRTALRFFSKRLQAAERAG